jgi:hypothetical protein
VEPAAVQPVPASALTSTARYQIALRFSPQRSFLANGKDPVTVHAFVLSRDAEPPPGFRVNLYDSSGNLSPKPLVIPRGAEEGRATLTYDHTGTVKVEYLGSNPPAELDGEREIAIHFDPPITGLEVEAKPSRISLLDTSQVLLTLVDDSGRAIPSHEPRVVSVALDSGRGELEWQEATIEAGRTEARVKFTPLWWGSAVVSATTPNLLASPTRIDVGLPLGLLSVSAIGGLLGGLVFVLRHPRAKRWRIPVGALTGVILLWAVLFVGLSALPRSTTLNPIGIFVISVLGGWLGTEVFEPVLKRLQLNRAK